MIVAATTLLAGWLFLHPVDLPNSARLWMLLPLVACVATVYRATRARTVAEMPAATVISFVQIIVGMAAIALAFYLAHVIAMRYL
jgi:hypothetical protein